MTEHNYKLEGRGSSPEAADNGLEANQSDLVKKLNQGKVSEEVTIVREKFVGEFKLKSGIDPSAVVSTQFTVEDMSGWSKIELKRQAVKDGGEYDSVYAVERYLVLTEEQLKAIRGTKQTSAGLRDYAGNSYLQRFKRI